MSCNVNQEVSPECHRQQRLYCMGGGVTDYADIWSFSSDTCYTLYSPKVWDNYSQH